jgi:hypothetical protein
LKNFKNTAEWTAYEFGNRIGIWLHSHRLTTVNYNADGYLTSFNKNSQSYVDNGNQPTTPGNDCDYNVDDYDPSSTYNQGDYVFYNGEIYQANTSIAVAEYPGVCGGWTDLNICHDC